MVKHRARKILVKHLLLLSWSLATADSFFITFVYDGFRPRSVKNVPLSKHVLNEVSNANYYGGANDATDATNDKPRRRFIRSFVTLSTVYLPSTEALALKSNGNLSQVPEPLQQEDDTSYETITIPLHWIPSLSAYVVYYSVGGKERFGAIVDTGSPFLVVPNSCDRQKYGCYLPEQSRPSGLPPTLERFDNNEGEVEWRMAPFSFIGSSGSMRGPPEMLFGVASESLLNGSGGVFMGLIRDTDSWIRPSFLGQTQVKSMVIDLRGGIQENVTKTMTLSTRSSQILTDVMSGANSDYYIPLVRDLNRKFGDPVIHYTAKASAFNVNGDSVLPKGDRKPIYVIFDTGVTGMVVSRDLFDQRYADARQKREKSLWGNVEVVFQTLSLNHETNTNNNQASTVSLTARKPVTTPLGMKPWPKFNNAHLIVLGLAFLDGNRIVIEMDRQRLQLTK